jgi:hypothetical protein
MQFFRGKNKKEHNSNGSSSNRSGKKESGEGQDDSENDNSTKMQESDLLNELDQLANEPTTSAEFSDDPQQNDVGGDVMDAIVAGVTSNLSSGGQAAAASGGGGAGGGVESLKMLDSDDGADMDIFDDDDDDYAGGHDDFAEKSPTSWVAGGPRKQVSPALREEIRDLLNTPLTIPTLVQPHKRDEGGTSDEDHDAEEDDEEGEGDEDKSSESGEDYTDDEDEGESGYKPGGYHPVNVGDIFNQG